MTDAWQQLARAAAADVADAQAGRGIVDAAIAPVYRPIRVLGPAFTVAMVAGDNGAIDYAIDEAPPESVLVITCQGDRAHACTGDTHARAAIARGLRGFVVDGLVRDARLLQELNFPVFARGLLLHAPVKNAPGERGIPLDVGGVAVRTGDIVVGDDDGIVIVAAGDASTVLAAVRERQQKDAALLAALAAGRSLLDLKGLPREA